MYGIIFGSFSFRAAPYFQLKKNFSMFLYKYIKQANITICSGPVLMQITHTFLLYIVGMNIIMNKQ